MRVWLLPLSVDKRISSCNFGLGHSNTTSIPRHPVVWKGAGMVESRILQIVRQFWENAIKLLLEDPRNVRDLLALAGPT